jgi:RND superfamily putative drug exporter
MLTALARFAYRRRRIVVTAWVVGLVAAVTVGSSLAGDWINEDRMPGTDSQQAYDLLQLHMADQNGSNDNAAVVFDGMPGHETQVSSFLAQARTVPGVISVGDLQTSGDGVVGLVPVALADETEAEAANRLTELAAQVPDVKTSFSGWAFQDGEEPNSEMIGMAAALVILVLAFGSIIAAGLPILVAVFGLTVGSSVVGIIANIVDMGEVTSIVMAMITIGVGIDYSLLIVSRYRTALQRTGNPEASVIEAIDHAGRAVLLAGSIVAISLMGLLTMGMATFSGLAVGAAIGVLAAVLASLTFTPALLGFVGKNINRLHIGRKRAAVVKPSRWATFVQRHAKACAAVSLIALVAMAAPISALRLSFLDEGSTPAGTTNRIAYDTVSRAFGPGVHGPILFVVENPGTSMPSIAETIRTTKNIVSVDEPVISDDGKIGVISAVSAFGPNDEKTAKLLHHLRDDVMPTVETGDTRVFLGGDTALDIDFAELCGSRLPLFVGTVLLLSFLLLMLVFRSVIIPLKAVIMNLLSLSAAGGLMVLVFQIGWGASLFDASAGQVEPWIPPLLFAIVFGLSMDYEIFLLTSIREAYRNGDNVHDAVLHGLGSTTRVITAAAAIMTVVFASFIGMTDLAVKMVGFGLASAIAIAIDATIVRLLLLPAVMTLLGDANWWLPKWLDRILPHWEPEGHATTDIDLDSDGRVVPLASANR